jgi:hypothetical protein
MVPAWIPLGRACLLAENTPAHETMPLSKLELPAQLAARSSSSASRAAYKFVICTDPC